MPPDMVGGMEPFIGQIMLFAGNFAPRGWALCNGQLLAIAQYSALFSILGTTYGGNGQTTFALPDLRGRAPIHFGQGPGLSNYDLGQHGGAESVTLTPANLPPHTHGLQFAPDASGDPANGIAAAATSEKLHAGATQVAGAGQPFDNRAPYTVMNYCIALEGIYPSRS
jgi:microcystin-dependent protein